MDTNKIIGIFIFIVCLFGGVGLFYLWVRSYLLTRPIHSKDREAGMFRKLFCKHEYKVHAFNYIKCGKCEKVKYDPCEAGRLLREKLFNMVDAGIWDKREVDKSLRIRGLMK